MQYTGQGSEKKSYRVLLLLIVGLAAFSSAMKELNKVQELTLQTGQLVAAWTGSLATETNEMLVKVQTCDSKDLPPLPDVPALPAVPPVPRSAVAPSMPADVEVLVPDTIPPAAPRAPEVPAVPRVVKPRRVVRAERDAAASAHASEVKVFVSTGEFDKALKDAFEADLNHKAFKAKNRRFIWIGPEGRDVILKTLNRSINLRAS